MIRLSSLSFAIIMLTGLTGMSQDLYDLEHSRDYAFHLYRSGRYAESARELERVVFMAPGDTASRLMLVKAYRFGGEPELAIRRNLELSNAEPSLLNPGFASEYSLSLILSGRGPEARKYLLSPNLVPSGNRNLYLLGTHALEADWESAKLITDTLPSMSDPDYLRLSYIVDQGSALHYKSPGLALGMSVVLPGAGKVYAGQWGDGIIALAFVGSNAWQSYRGFSRDGISSPYGWIFGVLALAFYAGDLYGSYQAVIRYNTALDAPLRDQTYHLLFDTP